MEDSFICDCNNKDYKSKQGLNIHKRSKAHQHWILFTKYCELKKEFESLKKELQKEKNYSEYLETENKNLKTELEIEKESLQKAKNIMKSKLK
jgi:hypothetical protein